MYLGILANFPQSCLQKTNWGTLNSLFLGGGKLNIGRVLEIKSCKYVTAGVCSPYKSICLTPTTKTHVFLPTPQILTPEGPGISWAPALKRIPGSPLPGGSCAPGVLGGRPPGWEMLESDDRGIDSGSGGGLGFVEGSRK